MRAWPILLGFLLGTIALLYGHELGNDLADSWRRAARYTARAALVLFLVTYCASAIARCMRGPLALLILRDRRWWGLAYVVAQLIHLYAFASFIATGAARVSPLFLAAGATGYAAMIAMALTSNQCAMRRLGAAWQWLHTAGIHGLWAIYVGVYATRVMRPDSLFTGAVGLALLFGALALRMTAGRHPPLPAAMV